MGITSPSLIDSYSNKHLYHFVNLDYFCLSGREYWVYRLLSIEGRCRVHIGQCLVGREGGKYSGRGSGLTAHIRQGVYCPECPLTTAHYTVGSGKWALRAIDTGLLYTID